MTANDVWERLKTMLNNLSDGDSESCVIRATNNVEAIYSPLPLP